MNLVFADFDQTITGFDTLLPFAHFLLQRDGRRQHYPRVVFRFALYRAGLLRDRTFRTQLCRLLVANRSIQEVAESAEAFYRHHATTLIQRGVWTAIREQAGPAGQVIVLSTNFDFIIEPLRRLEPNLVPYSTQAAVHGDRYSGALARHVGSGADKLRIFEAIAGAAPGCTTFGFGDSPTDHAFLSHCHHAWIVERPRRSSRETCRWLWRCGLGRFGRLPAPTPVELRAFKPGLPAAARDSA